MSLSLQKELTMSEADFQRFATKYRALLDEFTQSPPDEKDQKALLHHDDCFSNE